MRKLLAVGLACWSFLAFGETALSVAGKVELTDGEVRIYDAAKSARTPKVGDTISVGDSVVTGVDGELHLAMEDGGQIAVRPNTRMRIDKYKAEGGVDDRSVIGLLQGAMRSVTGWIGKYSPKNYQIRTPTATIGVRGTDHETHVIPPDSKEGEPGTYDKVNIGSTLLRTPQGTTEVHPDQAGFASHFGNRRPALLAAVPGFFRPGRHEERFAGLHERVHRQLEQRREERIRKVQEARSLRSERKLERGNDRASQREQRFQLQEARRKSGDAGSRLERRQQRQEQRLQPGAGNRDENVEHPLRKRREKLAAEHRYEAGTGEVGGVHRRH